MIGLGFWTLLAAHGAAAKRIVFLGDSLSAKLAPVLSRELSGKGFVLETIRTGSAGPSEKETGLSVQFRPDYVLLELGSDAASDARWEDTRDRFVPAVEGAVERLRAAASHPKVFLCLPPPSGFGAADPRSMRLATQIVPLLKQAARETDCPIIDFGEALKDRLDLLDGTTPDSAGAEILADTVSDALSAGRKADWKVVYADSEEADEGPAKNAIDGDPDTYWHTNYSTTQEKYPHELQVDTGAVRTIGGFSYLPRQEGVNGRVARYEFYVSLDGKNWGEPVAKGVFPPGGELTKVSFAKPVECRYFRFRALSEQQGQIWASAAELDILKFYPKRP